MPWCASCNKFLTPPTVQPDATCPKCGNVVERGLIPGLTHSADEPAPEVPWHLKLLGAAFVIYLAWRIIQIFGWIID